MDPRYPFWAGVAGIPFWLLSYLWVPFAAMGREDAWLESVTMPSELLAVLLGLGGLIAGLLNRSSWPVGTQQRRWVVRGALMGGLVLGLVVGTNALAFVILG